jgi:hypothetical protein
MGARPAGLYLLLAEQMPKILGLVMGVASNALLFVGMTYGISLWLPYHGTGTVACDNAPYYGGGPTPIQPYAFWSNTAPSLGCGIDIRVKGSTSAPSGSSRWSSTRSSTR